MAGRKEVESEPKKKQQREEKNESSNRRGAAVNKRLEVAGSSQNRRNIQAIAAKIERIYDNRPTTKQKKKKKNHSV